MEYKLPPLPDPEPLGMDFDKGWDGVRAYGYTAEQMQAYAIAAIEAQASMVRWSTPNCMGIGDTRRDRRTALPG